MLIDIPCVLIFDCSDMYKAGRGKANMHRIFTFRFETDDNDAPAKYTAGDPQNPKTSWSTDTDGIIFGLMNYGTDTELVKRAAKWPVDYCADIAEGERLQADIEALLRPCGECHLQPDERCDICGKRSPSVTRPQSGGEA